MYCCCIFRKSVFIIDLSLLFSFLFNYYHGLTGLSVHNHSGRNSGPGTAGIAAGATNVARSSAGIPVRAGDELPAAELAVACTEWG
jgi:hypothetical protein